MCVCVEISGVVRVQHHFVRVNSEEGIREECGEEQLVKKVRSVSVEDERMMTVIVY